MYRFAQRLFVSIIAILVGSLVYALPVSATTPKDGGVCSKVNQIQVTKKDVLICADYGTNQKWRKLAQLPAPAKPASKKCTANKQCAVGDIGPGGGIIFFVSETAFTAPGTACNTACRYLEAAPNSWNGKTVDPRVIWVADIVQCFQDRSNSPDTNCHGGGVYSNTVGQAASRLANTAIGMGQANTNAILSRQTGVSPVTFAAGLADNLVFGGVADWYLPSKDELYLMSSVLRARGFGGFSVGHYWSSSESHPRYAWTQYFADETSFLSLKGGANFVRPVRAFG